MRLPAKLPPEAITAIVDTREQAPLDLQPLRTITGTLPTGDYSVVGLESIISIERKSLPDLLGCVGRERPRFEREIQRLLAYDVRGLVIEATWQDLERGDWQSKLTPAAVLGSVLGWAAKGLPVFCVGDHERAGRYVSRILYLTARRKWQECRALAAGIESRTECEV